MARKPKTPKFEFFNKSTNCFGEHARPTSELWDFLDQSKPLVLEIGCGTAELSMSYARQNPDVNYIGLDRKSDRLFKPAGFAIEQHIDNIAFVQTDILLLQELFDPDSVSTIWVTFPDPRPRKGDEKHRLVNKHFMQIYLQLLQSGGSFHFKTDDETLFNYALEVIKDLNLKTVDLCRDVHGGEDEYDFPLTTYEKKWMAEGKKIMYVRIQT